MPSVSLAVACRGTAVYDACRSRRNCGRQLRAAAVRQRRPRLERRADALVVKAGLTEVAEAGAVNVLLGAVAFQWIGMAALVAAAPLYRDKMKEKPDWNTIHGALTEVQAFRPTRCAVSTTAQLPPGGAQGWRQACPHAQPSCPTRGLPK